MPRASKVESMDVHFLSVYTVLSRDGTCDRPHGAECQRVYQEWLDAGKPWDVARFIMFRANIESIQENGNAAS